MKKLLCLIMMSTLAFSTTPKIELIGVWEISSINQYQPLYIASSIAYNIVLRFNNDGILDKAQQNYQTFAPTTYSWKIKRNDQIHVKSNPSTGNFFSNFILRSHLNDYIKIEEFLGNGCYRVQVKHSNSKKPGKMCKISN